MSDVIMWDTLEHHHHEKSSDWFWSLGIIAVSIAIICILLNNILFALVILLAAFTAGQHALRHPRMVHIELHRKGILIGKHWHDYKYLDSFWIEEHDTPSIILKSKKILVPFIVVPIQDVLHDDIRYFLLEHLPEVEHHESLLHKSFEYLGF